MPDGAEKEAWQLAMHEYCPQCRAYQKHQVEKDRQLERIK
jgi:ribosomal protein L44E